LIAPLVARPKMYRAATGATLEEARAFIARL
jgi:hypothetical protein